MLVERMKFKLLTVVPVFTLCVLGVLLSASFKNSVERESSLNRLLALPYTAWTSVDRKDVAKKGCVKHDKDKAQPGINIFVSENRPMARLLDMKGNVIHEFSDNRDNWFQKLLHRSTDRAEFWKLMHPDSSGNFIALFTREAIFSMDWNSRVNWEQRGSFHHDFDIAENGDIYTLEHNKAMFPEFRKDGNIVDSQLVVISKKGEI
jgi:hypothetical protein